MRIVIAYTLSILLAPVAAIIAVAFLARASGRLTRWRGQDGGAEFMFSMPMGGFGWQLTSASVRALAVFAVARLVFSLLRVPPGPYAAAVLVLMLASWDIRRWRILKRLPFEVPPRAVAVATFKIGAGLTTSVAAGLLFTLV